MAIKKNNKRRYAAVVLGIVGVAGLSMASASNLTINAAPNIATGQTTIDAACDDTVGVDYTLAWNATTYVNDYASVDISGIHADCTGGTLEWRLFYDGGTEVSGSGSITGATFTGTLTPNIAGDLDLERIAITIVE